MTRRLVLLDSHAPPEEVRCERCRHWDHKSDPEVFPTREDKRAGIGSERRCKRITLRSDVRRMTPDCGAYTQDASSYIADLWAFPHFGCVQFEAKP